MSVLESPDGDEIPARAQRPRETCRPFHGGNPSALSRAGRRVEPERTLRAAPSAVAAPRRSAGRAMLGVLGFLLFLCVLAAMIAGSGYAGSQAGEQERNARATTTVQAYTMDRFQKCLDFMNTGNFARSGRVRDCPTLSAESIRTAGMLATIVVAQTPTALPPVPTPTPVLTDKGELFRLLKSAWDKKRLGHRYPARRSTSRVGRNL